MPYIDIIRLVVGGGLLVYASYTDIKTRKADNRIWITIGITGLLLLIFDHTDLNEIAISIAISIPFALTLYVFGMGGADVKSLWSISLLTPLPPQIGELPLSNPFIFVFPLIILLNSLILIVGIPLGYFIYNVSKNNCELPYCLFGYKIKASEAKNKFVWSMQNKEKKSIIPIKNCDFNQFQDQYIWVTPQIPFLLFICIGFIVSFLYGDIFGSIMSFIF